MACGLRNDGPVLLRDHMSPAGWAAASFITGWRDLMDHWDGGAAKLGGAQRSTLPAIHTTIIALG